MNSSLSATKAEAIGVLILEEFASFQAARFIEFIGRSKEYVPNQPLRWQDSKTRPAEGFNSHHGQCDLIVRGKSVDLHLFDLPMSLLPDFNLSDLIFPVEIRGCLLLANQEMNPSTWPRDRFPGWLDWIQAQKTTFLVAVTGSDSPALPVDEFLGYLSLLPETDVVELPSHHVGDSILKHVFDMAEAKRVLTILVENIMVSKFSASDHSV
jgi:hypothetical protein